MELHDSRCRFFSVGSSIFAAIRVGSQLQRLLVQLLDQSILKIGQHTVHLTAPDAVACEVELLVNQLSGLLGQPFAALDIEVFIPQECLVQRQHQQTAFHSAPHSGEARRSNLLEDGH